jgi:hypothetical protein
LLQLLTSCSKLVDNLGQAVRTQLVDGLLADLLQDVRFLRVYTRKISHLVTSLLTSRQRVVFALLVTSCQQVWNKLLTICNKLVDIIRLVTRLFEQW